MPHDVRSAGSQACLIFRIVRRSRGLQWVRNWASSPVGGRTRIRTSSKDDPRSSVMDVSPVSGTDICSCPSLREYLLGVQTTDSGVKLSCPGNFVAPCMKSADAFQKAPAATGALRRHAIGTRRRPAATAISNQRRLAWSATNPATKQASASTRSARVPRLRGERRAISRPFLRGSFT